MHYSTRSKNYPEWLITVIPGARALESKWLEAEEAIRPLRAAHRTAIAAKRGKVAHRGEPGNPIQVPAPGVSTAEFDAIMAACREAERAANAQIRVARKARDDFDAAMRPSGELSEKVRATAASEAAARHEEAQDAWKRLRQALAAREEAYRYAGRPGSDWVDRDGINYNILNEQSRAENFFNSALTQFDLDAVREIALRKEDK